MSGGGASTITIQTFGFGTGTNAAGMAIPAEGFDSLVALFKRHVFLTICFSPDDDPERKLELVLSERVASRLGQALASGSVGLMQEFNFSVDGCE